MTKRYVQKREDKRPDDFSFQKLDDMPDPLCPSVQLLIKLGSLIVHLEEAHSQHGHEFDIAAVKQLQADRELIDWRDAMTKAAFLPLKRNV